MGSPQQNSSAPAAQRAAVDSSPNYKSLFISKHCQTRNKLVKKFVNL